MKLKFKGEKKDFVIFGLFALFLLYVVAIAVVNIRSFAVDGIFSGLNPFPAFRLNTIGFTILAYIIALVALFITVKSYFFDTEKGIGISFGKDEKGYSRWAKDKEFPFDSESHQWGDCPIR